MEVIDPILSFNELAVISASLLAGIASYFT
jgi:hypothetical protein